MTDKNVIIRRCICAVVSFVLCICLFGIVMCAVLGLVCSEKYVMYTEEKSGYARLSLDLLKTDLEDLTIPSGFPMDFFDGKLDEKLYAERVEEAFSRNMKGEAISFTRKTISDEFYAMTLEYAKTQSESVSDEVATALRGLSDECADRYIRYANPSSVKYVLTRLEWVEKPLTVATALVAVIGVAAAVFLVFLCRGRDLAKHLVFAFSGAALLSGVIPSALLMTREVRRVSLTSPALHSLAVTYIEGVLAAAVICAAICLAVAVGIGLGRLIRRRLCKSNSL